MTTIHTNGTQASIPHFPGALSDAQAARFNGDVVYNQIIYGTYWYAAAFGLNVDAEISQLVAEVRQLTDEMEALEEKVQAAKQRLSTLLTLKGESWADDSGYARLIAESKRTSYDTKALDDLILKGKRYAFLRNHRREFSVRGCVVVK